MEKEMIYNFRDNSDEEEFGQYATFALRINEIDGLKRFCFLSSQASNKVVAWRDDFRMDAGSLFGVIALDPSQTFFVTVFGELSECPELAQILAKYSVELD